MNTHGTCMVFCAFRHCSDEVRAEFEACYDAHAQRLHMYVRRMLGDGHPQLDDVFQQAFIRMYECAGGGEEIHNVPAFLFRVARNLCLNEIERKRPYPLDEENIPGTDPLLQYETKDMHEIVLAAIDKLPVQHREHLLLKDQLGFSYDEIATLTGETPSAVRQRVSRARRMVRELLLPVLRERTME